ncbi:MAG: metallopeptidase TldD-related protein [Candidatus Falkowbacteria bacterium]
MNYDYKALAEILAEEVAFAKQLECNMEDPYGDSKGYHIKDISFHVLSHQAVRFDFMNSFLESARTELESSLLVRIWIGNQNKAIRTDFAYPDIPMNAEGLKIFVRQNIHHMISESVRCFFVVKKKDVRFSEKSEEAPEFYLGDVLIFEPEDIDDKILKRISRFASQMYVLDSVTGTRATLSHRQLISIVVDSDGRKILEPSNGWDLQFNVAYLNSQLYPLSISRSLYFMHDGELSSGLKKMQKELVSSLAENNVISFLDTGSYPILFDHRATHTLIHEALVGHLYSGDMIVNDQTTYFKNLQNKDLVNLSENYEILKQMTLLVDPTKEGVMGGYLFDQEGIRARKTVLCEKGVLTNYLLSRNSAARLKTKSNGHARAELYVDVDFTGSPVSVQPEARISHLIIETHDGLTDEELKERIKEYACNNKRKFDFYLEVSSTDGEVSLDTGAFTMLLCECRKVYFDGRRETVYGGTLSGTPHDFLANIKAVGSDLYYNNSLCGASSGWVPVSSETPKMFLTANFVPDSPPIKNEIYDFKRDKYIPADFIV